MTARFAVLLATLLAVLLIAGPLCIHAVAQLPAVTA